MPKQTEKQTEGFAEKTIKALSGRRNTNFSMQVKTTQIKSDEGTESKYQATLTLSFEQKEHRSRRSNKEKEPAKEENKDMSNFLLSVQDLFGNKTETQDEKGKAPIQATSTEGSNKTQITLTSEASSTQRSAQKKLRDLILEAFKHEKEGETILTAAESKKCTEVIFNPIMGWADSQCPGESESNNEFKGKMSSLLETQVHQGQAPSPKLDESNPTQGTSKSSVNQSM